MATCQVFDLHLSDEAVTVQPPQCRSLDHVHDLRNDLLQRWQAIG